MNPPALLALVVLAMGAALPQEASGPRGTPREPEIARAVAGTWVLQQVGSVAELERLVPKTISPALKTAHVRGFCLRVPWKAIDADFALLEAGLRVAREHGVEYSVRFMAGRHTPARLFEQGCRFYTFGGEGDRVPSPMLADGSPNLAFEREYESLVARLAAWCRRQRVALVHLAWYGRDWAELSHGKELRALEGYSYENWLRAHKRLLDIGLKHAGRGLAVELPLSGHGPLTEAAVALADHVVAKIGPSNPIFFCQANGWGPGGDWGAPTAETEAAFDRVWQRPICRGQQAIQPADYDWGVLFGRLYENRATYCEVYAPSFSMQRRAGLATEITRFAERVCREGPLLPAVGGEDAKPSGARSAPSDRADRPRLIVLTDVGGDPDDQQSMVRLMTFSSEFEIEGLIASAAGVPGELKTDAVKPELLRAIVAAYGEVEDNLRVHRQGFPAKNTLLQRIKAGNARRGVKHVGEGEDTEGSRWVISVVDRPNPRPVNVAIWGGSTELAQALWRVRHDRPGAGLRAFLARLRVYAIGHQDDTGPWIVENFPGLFYVLSMAPAGQDKREGAYRGMYLGGDESLTSRTWIDACVRTGHGALGAMYPPKTWTAPNPHGALKEGDTPSWLYFLPLGPGDSEHPSWGGWGGRFALHSGALYRDAEDRVGEQSGARATVWRWRAAVQNQFQARMDWCVKPYREANHAPAASEVARVCVLNAAPSSQVRLRAGDWKDPDGNRLSYRWWVYAEAGSYRGAVKLSSTDSAEAALDVPADAAGKEFHVILEVIDDSAPPLTSYRRTIVQVKAAKGG